MTGGFPKGCYHGRHLKKLLTLSEAPFMVSCCTFAQCQWRNNCLWVLHFSCTSPIGHCKKLFIITLTMYVLAQHAVNHSQHSNNLLRVKNIHHLKIFKIFTIILIKLSLLKKYSPSPSEAQNLSWWVPITFYLVSIFFNIFSIIFAFFYNRPL